MNTEKVGVVIVAAGESSRMGGTDKIFAHLSGRPLIFHTVDAFHRCSAIDQIVIVLRQHNLKSGEHMLNEYGWNKVSHICPGGARRQDSVKNGLNHLVDCQWVLIHDGARPCVSRRLILDGLKAARITGAAIPAIPAGDTVKQVSGDMFVNKTLSREFIYLIQTPQVFRSDIISQAYNDIGDDVTDDAAMVERLGYSIKVFAGSTTNIKVTAAEDLIIAEAILKRSKVD